MIARQLWIGIGLLAGAVAVAGCASTTRGGATGAIGTTPAATSVSPPTSAAPSTSAVSSTSAVPATSPRAASSTRAVPATPARTSTAPSARPTSAHPAPVTTKVPADASAPAAGACLRSAGAQVLVLINPDVPQPRCVIVAAGQHLAVRNNTGEMGQSARTVTLHWADYAPRTLAPGALTSYPQPFGSYLMPGVHRLQAPPMYAGSGAEIWLQR